MGKVSAMQCRDHARGTLSTANISNLWVHQTNRKKTQQRKAGNVASNQLQQCATKEFESDGASPHDPSTCRTVLNSGMSAHTTQNYDGCKSPQGASSVLASCVHVYIERVRSSGGGACCTALGSHWENTTGKGGECARRTNTCGPPRI